MFRDQLQPQAGAQSSAHGITSLPVIARVDLLLSPGQAQHGPWWWSDLASSLVGSQASWTAPRQWGSEWRHSGGSRNEDAGACTVPILRAAPACGCGSLPS